MHDCTFRVRSAVNGTTDRCGQCGGCAFGRLLQMEKLHRLGGREKMMMVAARLMDADGCGDDEEKEALADRASSPLLRFSPSSLKPGTFCSQGVSEQ
jgi:hypothetical protein